MDPRDLYRAADDMDAKGRDMETDAYRMQDAARDLYREADNIRGQARVIETDAARAEAVARDAVRDIDRTYSTPRPFI